MIKDHLGITGSIVFFTLLLVVIGIGGSFVDLWSLDFFGVKKANIEREIFNNTKSQVQGTIQSLSTYRLEYKTGDDIHKAALKEMILLEYNAFERKDLLPKKLKTFIENLD